MLSAVLPPKRRYSAEYHGAFLCGNDLILLMQRMEWSVRIARAVNVPVYYSC
jgi:hypothetical protein